MTPNNRTILCKPNLWAIRTWFEDQQDVIIINIIWTGSLCSHPGWFMISALISRRKVVNLLLSTSSLHHHHQSHHQSPSPHQQSHHPIQISILNLVFFKADSFPICLFPVSCVKCELWRTVGGCVRRKCWQYWYFPPYLNEPRPTLCPRPVFLGQNNF